MPCKPVFPTSSLLDRCSRRDSRQPLPALLCLLHPCSRTSHICPPWKEEMQKDCRNNPCHVVVRPRILPRLRRCTRKMSSTYCRSLLRFTIPVALEGGVRPPWRTRSPGQRSTGPLSYSGSPCAFSFARLVSTASYTPSLRDPVRNAG